MKLEKHSFLTWFLILITSSFFLREPELIQLILQAIVVISLAKAALIIFVEFFILAHVEKIDKNEHV